MTSATPISFYNSKIEYSTDGVSWNDMSGYSNSLAVSGGDRAIGSFFDYSDDVPKLTAGKRASLDVALKIAFTRAAADVGDAFETAYEAGSAMYVRWTPGLFASGQKQFASGAGLIKSFSYPFGDADKGDPVVMSTTVTVPSITKGTS